MRGRYRQGATLPALLLALLFLAACAALPPAQQQAPAAGRVVVDLAGGWAFRNQDDWTPGKALAAPAAAGVAVSLPHTWNRLGEYREARTAASDNRQGQGRYRRRIEGQAFDAGRRHFLEFDAVGYIADVWLNGRHLARHAGAFTRFRVELLQRSTSPGRTRCRARGQQRSAARSSTEHVIPLLGDFFIHGGIYRPARLISVPRSHIDLTDHGGPGIYATHRLEEDGAARVETAVRLAAPRAGQRVRLVLSDASGAAVAEAQVPVMIRQNFNHPSIVTWGIGNEVDIDMAFGRPGPRADARALPGELHALA